MFLAGNFGEVLVNEPKLSRTAGGDDGSAALAATLTMAVMMPRNLVGHTRQARIFSSGRTGARESSVWQSEHGGARGRFVDSPIFEVNESTHVRKHPGVMR